MKTNYLFAASFLITVAGLGAAACTDSSGNGAGNPGAAGTARTGGTPAGGTYFCSYHGTADTGAGMARVIWVQ